MNTDIEKEIAEFFQKRVRERIMYLLASKKRGEVFDKLAHNAEDFLDSSLMIEKSERPLDKGTLEKKLGRTVYVMERHGSFGSPSDGEFTDIRAALDELWGCGMNYILYGNGHLYVETEYDLSTHKAYLLKRNDR